MKPRSQLGGTLNQTGPIECMLVIEKIFVHVPEPALGGRGFRGLGSELRLGMQTGVGKVPENVTQLPGQTLIAETLDTRVRTSAIGALIVTVFDQRDLRVYGT